MTSILLLVETIQCKEETRPDPEALSTNIQKPLIGMKLLNCGAVVITSAQVHSTKPELFLRRFKPW